MKHLKHYEKYHYENINAQIGDYVIIDPYTHPKEVENWILNNIGQIIDIENYDTYIVKYENIPTGWEDHFSYNDEQKNIRKTQKSGIKHISKNKEELELIISQNKYNL